MKKKPKALPTRSKNISVAISPAPVASPVPPQSFPIVGIGASAGGLAAFEAFFSGLPAAADPAMAFVLVQHLAPDHESLLTELVRRYTRMKVFLITDGLVVQPGCVYIIPPGCNLAFLNGALHLLEPDSPRGQRLPIDYFFSSLAQDQHERAIGIVLSGTGSDGTLGVRAIKDEGGMVMVQTPGTTEFAGMPQSAIATGLVDYELPPAAMPAQLIAYAAHAFGKPHAPSTVPAPKVDHARKRIFILLRAQTGHDFSLYKPSTIDRRIERRMAVHQIDNLEAYARYLQQTPAEVEKLFRDLLIGVTQFFRDPELFSVLETQVIAALVAGKPEGGTIRIWVPGCSTGEEAYSIAILVAERMEALKVSLPVQVFATDIDSQAITTARAGRYPAGIAAHLSPERLARFYTAKPAGSGYRINKNIRDLLVFSEQDVGKDPPFSKLDLISCRNLLIYLGSELQRKLIALFHYALLPGGALFLGSSETVGEFLDLFHPVDRKARLYQRRELQPGARAAHLTLARLPTNPPMLPVAAKAVVPVKRTVRELTERALLQQASPGSVMVNGQGDILYVHGRAGKFLEVAAGEPGPHNILKMARAGLRRSLVGALHEAVRTNEIVRYPGVRVEAEDRVLTVNLTIHPVTLDRDVTPESRPYLVVLDEMPSADPVPAPTAGSAPPSDQGPAREDRAEFAALKETLLAKEEYLQSANEELQSSTEELKSSNEEMQSVNEELQSTNEELETSKEELQSLNEELATVNTELNIKVTDLSLANNDMNNLIAGTGIATIFLDFQLRILRFTPTASGIVNLIPGDVGLPIAHFVSNLVGYNRLVEDTQAVLDTLVPREVEVQNKAGEWYAMRLQPYRTLDNVIKGAVISFISITEIVRARAALQQANQVMRMAVVVRDSHDAITVHDLEGRILAWNPSAVRMYGWSEAEALQLNVRERIPVALRASELSKTKQLGEAEIIEPYRTQRLTKAAKTVEVWITATALMNESGQMYAVATTERASRAPSDKPERTAS